MIDNLNKCDEDGLFITDKHIFFFGSVFSNFHECSFKYSYFEETHEFFCSEQAFMWHKAMFFNDHESAEKILSEKHDPYVCKQLGRKVKNYDDARWNEIRYSVMCSVNFQKFRQNQDLKKFIIDKRFDGKTFVEASPYDKIWGIRVAIGAPTIDDETTWKGQNLLGKCITEIRKDLMN